MFTSDKYGITSSHNHWEEIMEYYTYLEICQFVNIYFLAGTVIQNSFVIAMFIKKSRLVVWTQPLFTLSIISADLLFCLISIALIDRNLTEEWSLMIQTITKH